ncbi:hypothetical protein TrCOL_g990 [Triparma columacea]|uniref:Uncharacterized protein n=1 Tax=Triparma columacea TaxID=722753 RepID=A0A9W7L1C1_9STRA|nr:hypothetical protein TrCOL_g990 [Triparma columacea]
MLSLRACLAFVFITPVFTFTFHLPINQKCRNLATCSPSTSLAFGLPSWIPGPEGDKDEKKVSDDAVEKPKIGLKGVVQLITAGAGSPFLGDYKGVDKETGNFMFELEANNLTDENGESKQTKAKYFEEGWVDEDAEPFRWPWDKKK